MWGRPDQAKFRAAVFEKFDALCLISGCETWALLRSTCVIPVSFGVNDEASNGTPLRADLHRLFDSGLIPIDAQPWTISVGKTAREDHGAYLGSVL